MPVLPSPAARPVPRITLLPGRSASPRSEWHPMGRIPARMRAGSSRSNRGSAPFPAFRFRGSRGGRVPLPDRPSRNPPSPSRPRNSRRSSNFVSGKVEITETQFLSLRQDPGIKFSLFRQPTPSGMISVPVGIVRLVTDPPGSAEKKVPMGFGYLTAPSDLLAESFNLLGIRSPMRSRGT